MRLIILILIFCTPLFGSFSLKDTLTHTQSGSFLVYEQGKTVTFLRLADKTENFTLLEEVSIPSDRFFRLKQPTRTWYEMGALGNTSWTVAKVDLSTGTLEKVYSYTRSSFLDGSARSFFSTLFNLKFEETPLNRRKKVGPSPGYGREDVRPIWHPPLTIEGKRETAPFNAYTAIWPNDGSELAGKKIEIYLPENRAAFFPFFIEIEGRVGSNKICAIDSGCCITKPLPFLPTNF